jgi:IS5 family transposase
VGDADGEEAGRDRQRDLLRLVFEEVIDLGHPLVRVAQQIDWRFLDGHFSSVREPGDSWPPLRADGGGC